MKIKSVNPATEKFIREYDEMSSEEIHSICNKSNNEFLRWRKTSFKERSGLMKKVASYLIENKEKYSTLMTEEMGKPINSSRSEIEKCSSVCNYYAENAEKFLAEAEITTDAFSSFITYQPLGVILAVMPWNFPFWQVFRFAVPAIMAGNTAVLKHSSNVFGCALAIEEVFRSSDFPEYVFKSLLVTSKDINEVISNQHIKGVSLTGSTSAGRSVAKISGENIKKTVLELGGNDPYIIFEDADIENAVRTSVTSKLINSGQSCIAAKRFIVVKKIKEKFENLFVKMMNNAKMGDPMSEDTEVGPLARSDLRNKLHEQVKRSVSMGAICILGGHIPERKGFFYPPTVLTEVKKGMPAYEEELFGPVAAIIPVEDEKEAIKVANDSVFGLGAAIFTKNMTKGRKIAIEEIEAGNCFVNTFVKSDPRLPFGGVKGSGYGRELSSAGIKEFVNIKTIYIK